METTEQNSWPRLPKSEVIFVYSKDFDINFRTCFGDERILHGEKLAVLFNFKQHGKLYFLRMDRIKQISDS